MMKLRHREPNLIQVSQLLSGRAKSETEAVQPRTLLLTTVLNWSLTIRARRDHRGQPSPVTSPYRRPEVGCKQLTGLFQHSCLGSGKVRPMCHRGSENIRRAAETVVNRGGYIPPKALTLSFTEVVTAGAIPALGFLLPKRHCSPKLWDFTHHPVMCMEPGLDSSHHQ